MLFSYRACVGLSVVLAMTLSALDAFGQAFSPSRGASAQVVPSGATPHRGRPSPGGKPGTPPGKPPTKPGKKPGEKKPGDKKEGDKPAEGDAAVKRPTEPVKKADPKELEVRPDEKGLVRFNFRGQPWQGILEWVAEISHMNIDWLELPGGYLDLVTQRAYTVPAARDLLNEHLLRRGYTILIRGEMMSVVNLKTALDASIVPRVKPADLENREPHEFVRVSFRLGWQFDEAFVEDLKPMLSPYHKLIPMKASNRVEVLDVVANLLDVHLLIEEEKELGSEKSLVRVFTLHFRRADEVIVQVKALMGAASGGGAPKKAMTPQQMAQAQQAAQRAAAAAAKAGKKPAGGTKPEVKTELIADSRENIIIATGSPQKLLLIKQAIEVLDVPGKGPRTLEQIVGRQRIYRLATIDPEKFIKTLREVGNLDPTTQLDSDTTNNAIYANASVVDHMTISSLIERLDGSARRFYVMQLRRRDAEYVAETISEMMGNDKKKESSSRSRFSFFGYGYGQQQQKKNTDAFSCKADVEFNMLLIRANETEIAEVSDLLKSLGEIPDEREANSRVRIIEADPGEETQQLLERVREMWKTIGPNDIKIIPYIEPKKEEADEEEPVSPSDKPTQTTTASLQTKATAAEASNFRLVQIRTKEAVTVADVEPDTKAPETKAKAPQITIRQRPDGTLVITSDDTEALGRMEQLVQEIVPPRRLQHKDYQLKYVIAGDVVTDLEEFFEVGEEKETDQDRFRSYYYGYGYGRSSNDDKDKSSGLGRRKPMRFMYRFATNTVIVMGGTPEELATVDRLIKNWDKPEEKNSQNARLVKSIKIKYSDAKLITDTMKEVFRDLLNAKDKALENPNKNKQSESRSYYYSYGSSSSSDSLTTRYKGELSFGVHPTSNMVIVSAPRDLVEIVETFITELDEAAKPSSTTVVHALSGNINGQELQRRLAALLGDQKGGPQRGENNGNKSGKPGSANGGKPGGGNVSVSGDK